LGVNAAVGPTGTIQASGDITAYFSDRRLKTNIRNIDDALNKILSLTGIYFTQNRHAEKFGYSDYTRQVGVIAQQIETHIPEIVAPAPFDVDENGNSKSGHNYLTVRYEKLIPVLVEAIKEQQKEIAKLMEKVNGNSK
jgi:hypothetical protein